MNMRKNPVLLILGYPLNFGHFGGLVWIKRVRVTDYIEKNNLLSVRKVSFVTSCIIYTHLPQRRLLCSSILNLGTVL